MKHTTNIYTATASNEPTLFFTPSPLHLNLPSTPTGGEREACGATAAVLAPREGQQSAAGRDGHDQAIE